MQYYFTSLTLVKFYVVLFPSPVGKVQTTILRLKKKKKTRIKNPDCVTKALFSNLSNITFVQILIIYLCTNMHCY